MSNLHCPNCDHLIGRIAPPPEPLAYPAPGADSELDERVTEWAADIDWTSRQPSGALFDTYVTDTGDTVTSHRRWARSMKRVGYVSTKSTKGMRVFVKR